MSGGAPTLNEREPHVLMVDWKRKRFNKFTTVHMEQQGWPINTKAVMKTTLGTQGHDKMYDRDYVSLMKPARGTGEPQYHIQDMEPVMFNPRLEIGGGGGWVHEDPLTSAFTNKQFHMDVDWTKYL